VKISFKKTVWELLLSFQNGDNAENFRKQTTSTFFVFYILNVLTYQVIRSEKNHKQISRYKAAKKYGKYM